MTPALMSTAKLAEHLSVSESYIRNRRDEGDWVEGVHWVYLNPTSRQAGIRYLPDLCLNWILTQSQPQKHHSFVQAYHQKHIELV